MRLAPPLASGFLLGVALVAPRVAQSQGQASGGTWALTNVRIETVTEGYDRERHDRHPQWPHRGGGRERHAARRRSRRRPHRPHRLPRLHRPDVVDGAADPAAAAGLRWWRRWWRWRRRTPLRRRATSGSSRVARSPTKSRRLPPTLRAARDAGITAALVAPSRGAFRGLSALIPMRDDSSTQFVVKAPVAMHMGFQGVAGRYPGTLLGVIAYERQQLYDAQRHGLLHGPLQGGPARRGASVMRREPRRARAGRARPAPAFFAASNENEIRRAVAIGKEFDLKLTIVGATEAFRAVDALKGRGRSSCRSTSRRPMDVTGWAYRGAQRRSSTTARRATRRCARSSRRMRPRSTRPGSSSPSRRGR